MRFKHIRQQDITQCGAACLTMLCHYYGREISLSDVSRHCHATTEGVSLLSLAQSAEELGFTTSAYRLTLEALRTPPYRVSCTGHRTTSSFFTILKEKDSSISPTPRKGKWYTPQISFNSIGWEIHHFGRNTLSHVSFDIPGGKVTAIVGASGSGKTTLIKLLLGFYPVSQGNIALSGRDINSYHLKWWRRHCGVVMQDGVIFSETIERNIAVDDGDVDEERLIHAARIANIHDFIAGLPLKVKKLMKEIPKEWTIGGIIVLLFAAVVLAFAIRLLFFIYPLR